MKVINHTPYTVMPVRAVLVAVHNYASRTEGRLSTWLELRIDLVNARKEHCSGYAQYNGLYTRLRIPRNFTTGRLAWLFWHELMHLYGYHHGQFSELTHAQEYAIIGGSYVLPRTDTPWVNAGALQRWEVR